LRSRRDYSYIFRVDYSRFTPRDICTYTVRDIQAIHNSAENLEFGATLHEFIAQFHNIDCRWENNYELPTSGVLSQAAALQESILNRCPIASPRLPFTGNVLIALALNCLAITIDFQHVDDSCPSSIQIHGTQPRILSEARYDDYFRLRPLIEVQKICARRCARSGRPTAAVDSSPSIDSTVDEMLSHLAHLSRETLLRQDPRDWPAILYVLCIITIILSTFSPLADWMQPLRDVAEPLDLMLGDLCRLYYLCTDGGQPFTMGWDRARYGALVEGDQTAMWHCDLLNEMWLNANGRFYMPICQSRFIDR
jgi:hypothetical protein